MELAMPIRRSKSQVEHRNSCEPADGLILREDHGFKDRVPKGIPTIISSESEEFIPGCGHVIGNQTAIGRMGAEYLLRSGFKNFAYCGFDDIYWSRGRCKGYCDFIEESGRSVHVYRQPKLPPALLWEKEQS